jgi:tRNA (guanine6-N2)-methyltransferase
LNLPIFALAARGLEWLAAQEMGRLAGLEIRDISYRRIAAEYSGPPDALLTLRTVEDVFIDLDTWKNMVPQREALSLIKELSSQLDLEPAVEVISRLRPLPAQPRFSITAGFVGKRNYTWIEIREAAAAGLAAGYAWQHSPEANSELNLRIFIDHQRAYVGLRLGEKAMHQRGYKSVHLEGALKPSTAAALVELAQVSDGQILLDPLCGTGTILIEGALVGARSCGGDIDPAAVEATRLHCEAAGVSIGTGRWDARRLPLPAGSVDRIVTNLPWGRQVHVDEEPPLFYRRVCAEMERVLAEGGRLVLLTNSPEWVVFSRLEEETRFEISLFGQNPTVVVGGDSGQLTVDG